MIPVTQREAQCGVINEGFRKEDNGARETVRGESELTPYGEDVVWKGTSM